MSKNSGAETIPVVDLFAGPGGLGEGFSNFKYKRRARFRIVLSVEKDPYAHRTLRLRSFVRKLNDSDAVAALATLANTPRRPSDEEDVYREFPEAIAEADYEVLSDRSSAERELGSDQFPAGELDAIIRDRLAGAKNWVLIGGPPCQAYSLVGRAKLKSLKGDEFEKDDRHFLYRQYLRIIGTHQPPAFVMENVKGMLSSTIGGKLIVDHILRDLRQPMSGTDLEYELYPFVKPPSQGSSLFGQEGFNASSFVIRSEDHGIPQRRHRVIILGIRKGLNVKPTFLAPQNDPVPLRSLLADLPELRSKLSRSNGLVDDWMVGVRGILDAIGRDSVPAGVAAEMHKQLKRLDGTMTTGSAFSRYKAQRPSHFVKSVYRRRDLGGVCNHESRRHMLSDLHRYFYAACYGLIEKRDGRSVSPKLRDFPASLLPDHGNVDHHSAAEASFADRFRVQVWNEPATTVTSHIAKDGHYFIHPDPSQCRSLTVREAARIQTFPDDYIFLGTRTAQYYQVGNAVPPLLAEKLSGVVYDVLRRSGLTNG